MSTRVTYTDNNGATVGEEGLAGWLDEYLEEQDRLFVRGSDGRKYLVNVAVSFIPQED